LVGSNVGAASGWSLLRQVKTPQNNIWVPTAVVTSGSTTRATAVGTQKSTNCDTL